MKPLILSSSNLPPDAKLFRLGFKMNFSEQGLLFLQPWKMIFWQDDDEEEQLFVLLVISVQFNDKWDLNKSIISIFILHMIICYLKDAKCVMCRYIGLDESTNKYQSITMVRYRNITPGITLVFDKLAIRFKFKFSTYHQKLTPNKVSCYLRR